MKRPKGPELKLPKVKPPAFLADVYWDLRDRRLLPLIGLVVVAIAAVPFLLGDSEETTVPPLATGVGGTALEANASSLTVVEAQPGLRDYRKRLSGRSPVDPFAQRLTAPQLKGAKLNDAGEGSGGGSDEASGAGGGSGGEAKAEEDGGTTPPAAGADGGSTPGSGSGSAGSGTQQAEADPYAGTIDVKIVREGGSTAQAEATSEESKPIVKRHVQPQAALPGPNLPVFRYMGPSREAEGHRPLLLVSTEVRSVFGETRCIAGEEACQLLEVEPGFPVTFVYGPAEVHYTVTVLKIVPPTGKD